MRRLGKLFRPPWPVTLLLTAVSTGGLIWVFTGGYEESGLAYLFYALSAYTLAALCLCVPPLFRWGKGKAESHALLARWLHDLTFRTGASLGLSLAVNSLLGGFKLAVGVWLGSWWELTLGCYYIVLALARFLLLRDWRPGSDLALEQKKRRRCGLLLLILDVPLAGMAILVVANGEGRSYPGYLIYATAFYTFYYVISALVAQVRYRRYKSPVFSAAKTLSLANALVSLLSLQTAMFAAFGGEEAFQRLMNTLTGTGVCAAIALLGIWMLLGRRADAGTPQTKEKEE